MVRNNPSPAAPANIVPLDSPEALGAALCNIIPAMKQGFIVMAGDDEIQVLATDAAPFVAEMELLLLRHIHRIQQERYDAYVNSLNSLKPRLVGLDGAMTL